MNRLRALAPAGMAAAGSLLMLFPAATFAQWPNYPTGAPKTPDGKVDMNAPTPRTADGHPDLSGLWAAAGGGGGGGGRGRGGAGRGGPGGQGPGGNGPGGPNAGGNGAGRGPGAGPGPAGAPQGRGPGRGAQAGAAPAGPPLATFFNIAQNIPGGAPLQPWAADVLKKRMADNMKDNPDAHCLPLGLMQLHLHPQPRKIIQTPKVTVILYEAQAGVRQIFTDGRPSPPADAEPWWYGYSVGHWEGDDLVVTTTGFRDDVWLDVDGTPLTNSGKLTERFRRPNYGTLQIDITVEDPHVFTKPFTVRVNQRIMADQELIEFICNENERSDAHLVGGDYKSPADTKK